MFGRGKRELIANLLERSGVLRLLENSPFTDSLLVLSYNRVLHARDCPFDRGAISATPDQFTELARFPAVEGKTWNHPVLVGDLLLVRNDQEMVAFRLSRAGR